MWEFVKNQKLGLIGLAILVMLMGAAYRYRSEQGVRKFTGYLVSAQADTLVLYGVFSDRDDKIREDAASRGEFRLRVDDTTRYWRTLIRKPALNAANASSGVYFIDDLPKEEGPGTFADLAGASGLGGVYVEAEFPYSAFAPGVPVASTVIYRITSRAETASPGT